MSLVNEILEQPHSQQAEQAILGALLYNNLFYEKIAFLEADHFYLPIHKIIYSTIVKMIYKGELVTPITISPIFKENEIIINAGGAKYWVNLVTNIGPIVNISSNAKHIFELYLRRSMINLSFDCIKDAKTFDVEKSVGQIIEHTESEIFKLTQKGVANGGISMFKDVVVQVIAQAKQASLQHSLVGVSTGLEKLDSHLGGFHKSDLLILAGRPSMGKTALATTFAFNAAKKYLNDKNTGAKVCFFSLEMSSEQLVGRIVAQEADIPSDRIRKGIISHQEFVKLEEKSKLLYEIPLYIDDTPALTMAGLRTRSRRLLRQENIGLIIIDYLQLLRSDKGFGENRVQELSEITRGLKALAKELNIPIIALSQLSRAVEQREDKQPQLSDLRESGSIEQDSDVVMFIYREAYYEGRKKPPSGSEKMQEWQLKMSQIYNKAELIIAKQRHGPIGNIELHFDEAITKFSNLDKTSNL